MPERYILELEALPGDDRPADMRLRGLLKVSLRRFGLRCTRCGWAALPHQHSQTAPPGDAARRRLKTPGG
jgi:hypothetical protein